MTALTPSGDNTLLGQDVATRKIGRLERFLGPENYRILTGLLKTPASIGGLILIGFFIFIAIAAPVIMPPVTPNDIFYGMIWGTRTAFQTGLVVTFSTFLIGIIYGSISAYYGGIVDNLMMRVVDVLLILPGILAVLILAAVLTPRIGKSLIPAMAALIAFGWMGYSRIIRGDILSVKERDYVLAARVIGVKDSRILFRHILPNAIFPTLVLASLAIGDVVLSFAALSFLGIGTEVGYADWGQVLSFARNWITSLNTYWYIIVWPGLTLVFFVMGWNLVGDALRDVLDPRMRGKT